KGLYNRLVARGSMRRLLTEEQVLHAVDHAPTDTRVYFRGEVLRRYGDHVVAASWDSVIFDVGPARNVRVPMAEARPGTSDNVEELFAEAADAAALVDALTR